MPIVLYGLSNPGPCAGGPERTKVATFTQEFLAKQYADYSETSASKKRRHYGRLDRKYYKWSLLNGYDGYETEWEDNDEVPHDPKPTKEQKIE